MGSSTFNFDTTEPSRIYVIDDDPEIQTVLESLFKSEGHRVIPFLCGMDALKEFQKIKSHSSSHPTVTKAPSLIICDLKLPDFNGLDLIQQIMEMNLGFPIILITAFASIETAIDALNRGAFDYITKPMNLAELKTISNRAIKHWQLEQDFHALQDTLNHTQTVGEMTSKSSKMQKLFKLVETVAKSVSNVLITGESGTGKEMIARTIHLKSDRSSNNFIAVNCSAIPENLLESELFGHKRGSFTGANESRRGLFEEANGGTLFLDEIGDMSLVLQAKLLRVLQERKVKPIGENAYREVDVRIIAATHKDLKKAIQDKLFREDLYYRLCVIPIELPPLRERKEDIQLLSNQFLAKYCALNKVPRKQLSKSALSKLLRYKWSGNIRELENTIERAVVLSQRDTIDEYDIRVDNPSETDTLVDGLYSKLMTFRELEMEYLKYVLIETGNKKEKAAEILGINRKSLYRKEREYKIEL